MAEKHDTMLRQIRLRYTRRGYKETTSPIPTYRPDYFGVKNVNCGRDAEIIVEVEIESSLFYEAGGRQVGRSS